MSTQFGNPNTNGIVTGPGSPNRLGTGTRKLLECDRLGNPDHDFQERG